MGNEYDSQGRLILRDSQGTIISMYRFFQLVLGASSCPGNPPDYWGGYSGHQGYDFPADTRTPIRSTCYGKVVAVFSEAEQSSMGNSCCIEEVGQPAGSSTRYHRYLHMVKYPEVSVGDTVEQGTLLGYVGTTGNSTGPHLHYDTPEGSYWGARLDAWKQFNPGSQPSNWNPGKVIIYGPWSCIEDTAGIDYGPYKGGGGGTTPSPGIIQGTPVLVPAKKIIWDPVPGTVLKPGSIVRISTNAEDATLYFTSDNTVPTTDSMKSSGVIGFRGYEGLNWFFRVRAFNSSGKVVAQGSACYGWVWKRTSQDVAAGLKIILETNRRPYLKYEEAEPVEETSNTS